jgi:hypothetical protein
MLGELCGLGGKVAGNALVEPALELGGQIKNFDGHGGSPFANPLGLPVDRPNASRDASISVWADT